MPSRKDPRESGTSKETRQNSSALGVKIFKTLDAHDDIIHGIAFDPTGHFFATASRDTSVKIWDMNRGELVHSLEWHERPVYCVAFNPTGTLLASAGADSTVRLWEVASGKLLATFNGHRAPVHSIAFDPQGRSLASGSSDATIKLWKVEERAYRKTLSGHEARVNSVAFDQEGLVLASASDDGCTKIWDVETGRRHSLRGHSGRVLTAAFQPGTALIATAGTDSTIKVWHVNSGEELFTLESHTASIEKVTFFNDGSLLASRSVDGKGLLWNCNTWEPLVSIAEARESNQHLPGLEFHPRLPYLAMVGSGPDAHWDETSKCVHFVRLDLEILLGGKSQLEPAQQVIHHTTAKIVLVGDHAVGKSALGHRIATGKYRNQPSSHGQQFWVLRQLAGEREDGTICEAILWDLAGQPDYRLTHALFLDDVDLALIVFDASNLSDPLKGVEYWLRQLGTGKVTEQVEGRSSRVPDKILVAGIGDRGTPALTPEDIENYAQGQGFRSYVPTSAKEGWGVNELVAEMRRSIAWEQKPATVTTTTFKRIKDYVLDLKQTKQQQTMLVVRPDELRQQLEKQDSEWSFSDAEMMTAIGHLENYGYVKRLRTSEGELRILLDPQLLNNLASSFVKEARNNPGGLGALEERRIAAGEYEFPELRGLQTNEIETLIDATSLAFLEHKICFRKTNPLGGQSFLVFPELINLKRPPRTEDSIDDGASYKMIGAVENVYASMVVLLGYTQTFRRTDQWQNQAQYEMGDGLVCGFRQVRRHEGELELILYFGKRVGRPVRNLFQGLFESFLASQNVEVFRYEPVVCGNCGQTLGREVAVTRLDQGKDFACCSECGQRLTLPISHEQIQLTQLEQDKIDEQQLLAAKRSKFEQAIYRVTSYVDAEGLTRPQCFVSYAWGDQAHERWVEYVFASDLKKAGVLVILDKWHNARTGKSVTRFVSDISKAEFVIPVGTPDYLAKFENDVSPDGSVVAAEVAVISQRLIGNENEKETVKPVLRHGDKKTSLPPLMHDLVRCDLRDDHEYYPATFDLILDLYDIAHNDPAVLDFRESLRR